jgi:hypothetical protein
MQPAISADPQIPFTFTRYSKSRHEDASSTTHGSRQVVCGFSSVKHGLDQCGGSGFGGSPSVIAPLFSTWIGVNVVLISQSVVRHSVVCHDRVQAMAAKER